MEKENKLALIFLVLSFLLILFKTPLSSSLSSFLNSYPPRSGTNELENEAYVNFIKSQRGEYNSQLIEAVFQGKKVRVPKESLTAAVPPKVLGQTTEYKWIEIDLSEQRLYAHEGDRLAYNFLVSTGKWAPTPQGEFRIWIKLRYATMHGGNQADGTYYYLPNVPYTMYFYQGYGLHGTYWHNNFGQPMSHGCVNLAIPDAEKLFWWAGPMLPAGKTVGSPTKDNPGTKVVIHE